MQVETRKVALQKLLGHSIFAQIVQVNLPSLANVDNVDTISTSLPEVWLHVHLEVLAANMALSSQEHLNVLSGGVEHRRQVVGGHLV